MFGGAGEYTVLEVDEGRLIAVAARVGLGRIEVTGWHAATRTAPVRGEGPDARGRWAGEELARAGLPRGRVVLVVPRGEVVLKVLSLPRPAEGPLEERELAAMVRLQMARQLAMTGSEGAVDYTLIAERPGAAGTGTVEVLAAALSDERMTWWREFASAGDLRLSRMTLRCMGVGAVVADIALRRGGPVLGIGVGASAADAVVVEDGRVAFARSVDAPRPTGESEFESFIERIVVEAKRTWMSHRGGRSLEGLEGVAVLGAGQLCETIAERCGQALGVRGETVSLPLMVRLPEDIPADLRAEVDALLGLLLETLAESETLNFARPRKAPDAGARRRRAALLGLLCSIVLGGIAYIAGDQNLRSLDASIAELEQREKNLRQEADTYMREHARITHLEHWKDARVEWLSHLAFLSSSMPDPSLATLDEITGRATLGVVFTPKGGYPGGAWSEKRRVTFDLSGKVEGRQVASDWRSILLSSGVYEVEARGADNPDHFSLSLTSTQATPGPSAKTSGEGGSR
jgi:hypothetical protein